ncbi:WD40 repeat domain-containing protein [Streptomyces sp. NPDC005209]|uniref:WD40 repeat domain-containing protein n=1 Tax=Streptomyces sp. NPDC005209 TaxID=3156715 RepID=UPI0033B3EA61
MHLDLLHDLRTQHGRTSIVAFAPRGEVLLVGASKATTLWAISAGQRPSLRATVRPGRGPSSVTTAGFHPLSPVLATNGGRFSIASFWECGPTSGLSPIVTYPWSDKRAAIARGEAGAAFVLAFRPGTTTLATGHTGGTVRLWDASMPSQPCELDQLRVTAAYVDALAFSPDGTVLAVADHVGHVNIWHYASVHAFIPVYTSSVATGRASYLTFSFDGRLFAANTFLDVAVWDSGTASTQPTARLTRMPGVRTGMARAVAFHPRLPVLACGDVQGAVSLWDLSDSAHPRLVAVIPVHHRPVTTLSFHPSGGILAVGCRDGMTALWAFAEA